jgi:drug/metabolite transporter (DMT)-like permease
MGACRQLSAAYLLFRCGHCGGAALSIGGTFFHSDRRIMTLPSNLRGVLSMVIAMGVFISSDSCMKLALGSMPLFELVLLRGLASVLLCLIVLVAMDLGRNLMMMFNPWLLARGACEVIANFGFTFAIFHMPIADVTAIAQTCPLLVLVGAKLIWGEHLGVSRLLLIALGISGALLVAQPGTTAASPYAILGFLVALSAAGRDLITRKVPGDIPAPIVAFTVLVILMMAGGASMMVFETPVFPDWRIMGLMFLAGALMLGGHICIFLAYKIGPARSVAPFMYSLTLWAVLAGAVVFGDIPNHLAIAGIALIMLAGIMIFYVDGRSRSARHAPPDKSVFTRG